MPVLWRATKMKYFVYILKSTKDNKLYTGYSEDPIRRLKDHNSGRTKSLLNRRPLVLVYQEEFNSEIEAKRREKFLKSGQGRKLIRLKLNRAM